MKRLLGSFDGILDYNVALEIVLGFALTLKDLAAFGTFRNGKKDSHLQCWDTQPLKMCELFHYAMEGFLNSEISD